MAVPRFNPPPAPRRRSPAARLLRGLGLLLLTLVLGASAALVAGVSAGAGAVGGVVGGFAAILAAGAALLAGLFAFWPVAALVVVVALVLVAWFSLDL